MKGNSFKPVIYAVDAHAGSGKTYSAHKFISQNPDKHFTVCTQTNALSEQQRKDLAELGVEATVFNMDTVADSCTEDYNRHCEAGRRSTALLNQGVALQQLPKAANQNVIFDEITSPLEKFKLVEGISATRKFIADLFPNVRDVGYESFIELTKTDEIEEIATHGKKRQSSVAVLPHVREICKRIVSPHHLVLVNTKNYLNFRSNIGEVASDDDNDEDDIEDDFGNSRQTLVVYVWLLETILDHLNHIPTFMGANFYDSKLALFWGPRVDFRPHPSIRCERNFDVRSKSHLMNAKYLSEKDVSRTRLDKTGYQTFVHLVADAVQDAYGSQPHIVTMNTDKDYKWSLESGEVLSPNPMGLNEYQDRHLGIHLAPLNPSKMDIAIWWEVAEVTSKQLMIAQANELQYQFMTRLSVRDAESEKPVDCIFLDKRSADRFREVMGIEKPAELFVVPGFGDAPKKPRKTRSDKKTKTPEEIKAANAAKMARYRARKAAAAEMTI